MSRPPLFYIVLEGLPPTVNHMYRNTRNGIRYKTADARAWQERVTAAMARKWAGRKPYEGYVSVLCRLLSPDKKLWDVDNRIKALQDCLERAGVIKNDRQVWDPHYTRVLRPGRPIETQVTMWAFSPEEGSHDHEAVL